MKTRFQTDKEAVHDFIKTLRAEDSYSRAGLAVEAANYFGLDGGERDVFLSAFAAELNEEGLS